MRRHLRLAAVTFAVSLLAALLSRPAPGLTLTGVQSRKAHGAAGNFDLAVDRAAAIGGAVNGGSFYGGTAAGSEFPTVALLGPNDVGQGRLLPVTSVDEYGATFAKWMGASNGELNTVFPNLSRFARPTGMSFLA